MSAEAPLLERSFRVGKRRVTITVRRPGADGLIHLFCEWAPGLPHRLSAREQQQYLAARDAVTVDIARELGIACVVLEV